MDTQISSYLTGKSDVILPDCSRQKLVDYSKEGSFYRTMHRFSNTSKDGVNITKVYDNKSRKYFNSTDFNSLTKLEKTRLKFTKFQKLFKRSKTILSMKKPKSQNRLSLKGQKMYVNRASVHFMNQTYHPAGVNIQCETEISRPEPSSAIKAIKLAQLQNSSDRK